MLWLTYSCLITDVWTLLVFITAMMGFRLYALSSEQKLGTCARWLQVEPKDLVEYFCVLDDLLIYQTFILLTWWGNYSVVYMHRTGIILALHWSKEGFTDHIVVSYMKNVIWSTDSSRATFYLVFNSGFATTCSWPIWNSLIYFTS